MSGDFFDRLGTDLADLTRQGAHLDGPRGAHRRLGRLIRRGAAIAGLTMALAVSLVSEFPASASGHAVAAHTVMSVSL
jgi:hypothetical protein